MTTNTFAYNGFGARVSKTDSAGTTTYLRSGTSVVAPVVADSGAVYTPGISERRGSASRFYHGDIKNFVEQTDSSGQIVSSQQYDAFGNVVSTGGAWSGPFAYGGRFGYQSDSDTSLSLLGHRYYDSTTGRFLTRDPIGDGRNWYAYCYNNPINLFDASGLEPAPAEFAPEALLPDGRRTEGGRMGPDPSTWYTGAADFFAGWGDTLTLGGTYLLRELAGLNDVIDGSSGAYRAGIAVGVAHWGAMVGNVAYAWWRADPTKPVKLFRLTIRFRKSTPRFGGRRAVSFDWTGKQVGRFEWSSRHGWHWNTPDGRHIPIRLPRPDPLVLPLDDRATEQERGVPTIAPVVGGI